MFTSRVSAQELYFRAAPRSRVEFSGGHDRESASGSDRINLPAAVSSGATYRGVQVDYRIISRLNTKPDHHADDP